MSHEAPLLRLIISDETEGSAEPRLRFDKLYLADKEAAGWARRPGSWLIAIRRPQAAFVRVVRVAGEAAAVFGGVVGGLDGSRWPPLFLG